MKLFFSIFLLLTLLIVSGCGNSKKIEKNNIEETSIEHPIINSLDFYASPNDKSWNLSIQFNDHIIFTDSKKAIHFIGDTKTKIDNQGNIQISAKDKTYYIEVNIKKEECNKIGVITEIKFEKIAEKETNNYVGCGIYRGSPQLHDIWVLYGINDKILTPDLFPDELPHFEIDLTERKISGFAGCNQVNGNLTFGYQLMNIQSLVSTRMYCGEASQIEEDILEILRTPLTYKLEETHLYLTSEKGKLLLKKID